jgi:hypothetical protein
VVQDVTPPTEANACETDLPTFLSDSRDTIVFTLFSARLLELVSTPGRCRVAAIVSFSGVVCVQSLIIGTMPTVPLLDEPPDEDEVPFATYTAVCNVCKNVSKETKTKDWPSGWGICCCCNKWVCDSECDDHPFCSSKCCWLVKEQWEDEM